MAKGYWIARVDVIDLEAYKLFIAAIAEPLERFGARYVIRGGETEIMEGEARSRNVVIEFPSYEKALECYRDTAYQAAKEHRKAASVGEIIIIEGYAGAQPGD